MIKLVIGCTHDDIYEENVECEEDLSAGSKPDGWLENVFPSRCEKVFDSVYGAGKSYSTNEEHN